MIPLVLGLGFSAVQAGMNWLGSKSQADQAEAQARALAEQSQEQARREELQMQQQLKATQAQMGASGLDPTSASMQNYLSQMAAEFRRELDWSRSAAAARVGGLHAAAGSMGTAGKFKLTADLGASFFDFAKSNNWFK